MKHQMGSVTHVVAILERPEILPKMLSADVDVRPVDAALQLRPEALHRVEAGTESGRITSLNPQSAAKKK